MNYTFIAFHGEVCETESYNIQVGVSVLVLYIAGEPATNLYIYISRLSRIDLKGAH